MFWDLTLWLRRTEVPFPRRSWRRDRVATRWSWSSWSLSGNCDISWLCKSQSMSGVISWTNSVNDAHMMSLTVSTEHPEFSIDNTSMNLSWLCKLINQTMFSWDNTSLLKEWTNLSISLLQFQRFPSVLSTLDNSDMIPTGQRIANCLFCSNKFCNSLKLPSECMIPMWSESLAVEEAKRPWLMGFFKLLHNCTCLDSAAVSL